MSREETRVKTNPGGYHSEGVPGEKADLRKRMRVFKVGDANRFVNRSRPVKGGLTAQSTARGRAAEEAADTRPAAGAREVFLLARTGIEEIETPVFESTEADGDILAVFTTREHAVLYLQASRWGPAYEPAPLAPGDLGEWARAARDQGIRLMAVNPNRLAQERGEPQPVLHLDEVPDPSGDNLYREVNALGGTPAV